MIMLKKSVFMPVLALVVVVMLIMTATSPLAALTIAPDDEVADVTQELAYVMSYLDEWMDQLLVNEYDINAIPVLQIHLVVPSLDYFYDGNMPDFEDAFSFMLDEEDFPYERVYLDFVNEKGERLESYDFAIYDLEIDMATFERAMDDAQEEINSVVIDVNQAFTLGEDEFYLKSYTVLQDENGPYLQITYDYTNNSGDMSSAYLAANYLGMQNDTSMDGVPTLDDWDTTYKDVESGSTVEDCIYGFYLTTMSDPVTITIQEFMGDDEVTFNFEIASQGSDTIDKASIEIGQPFLLGDNEFMITSYNIYKDDYGPYLVFTFDYTNNTGDVYSAYMAGDYYGIQDGIELERVMILDDTDTTYQDIESGSTVNDCIVGFYLDNLTDPVLLWIEEYMGNDVVTYTFEIDSVG